MRVKDIPEIEKLSISEKILLVEDIWDSIATEESSVLVPQAHIDELDRRHEKHKSGLGTLMSLDELKKRIDIRK